MSINVILMIFLGLCSTACAVFILGSAILEGRRMEREVMAKTMTPRPAPEDLAFKVEVNRNYRPSPERAACDAGEFTINLDPDDAPTAVMTISYPSGRVWINPDATIDELRDALRLIATEAQKRAARDLKNTH